MQEATSQPPKGHLSEGKRYRFQTVTKYTWKVTEWKLRSIGRTAALLLQHLCLPEEIP